VIPLFSIEVEFLMKRVYAASWSSKKIVEWPPHPSRLFSALVASYEESVHDKLASQALEWLEALPPPEMYVEPDSLSYNYGRLKLTSPSFYVPVNDNKNNPEKRKHKERYFPSLSLRDGKVYFIWNQSDENEEMLEPLQKIAENVTYLGTSKSPVRVAVNRSPPEPNLVPDRYGKIMLRTTRKGRKSYLEYIYTKRDDNLTVQPRLGAVTPYILISEKTSKSEYYKSSMKLVSYFKFDRKTLPSGSINAITTTMRRAILSLYPEPIPEIVSGHTQDGEVSTLPHIAITPFPDAGHDYADGHVMGIAVWLPVNIEDEIMRKIDEVCSKITKLTLGESGVINVKRLKPVDEERIPFGIRPSTYRAKSDIWATVTPIIFGKHPKKSSIGPGKDGGKVFREMCAEAGLPEPVEVRMGKVSIFQGAPTALDVQVPEKMSGRLRAHALIKFKEKVEGPVIIGAGRYYGFGLCKPWYSGVE
jgi:CRISPR-associated protein Csb2